MFESLNRIMQNALFAISLLVLCDKIAWKVLRILPGKKISSNNSNKVASYFVTMPVPNTIEQIIIYQLNVSQPAFTCLKSTTETPEQWVKSAQMSLLLTLNRCYTLSWYFYYSLWATKCRLEWTLIHLILIQIS